MSTAYDAVQNLGSFPIGLYRRSDEVYERNVSAPRALPSPLLDPATLQAAMTAYDDASDTLRARVRCALRPGMRHSLANRILSLAIFGERDHRLLSDRALAHFL